jgi:Arc/MetJ-type ribon-helix-helix transcriptional regulator
MATEMKRMTFAVTKEMEALLDRAKKNMFYDCNQSDMIREILTAGLEVMDEKAGKEKLHKQSA